MRNKTKKLLRKCAYPFVWLWVIIALTIGYTGIILQALTYIMLGNVRQAKRVLTQEV